MATEWKHTTASDYAYVPGAGGACGFLDDGNLHYAELGAADQGGGATGHGNIAALFGYSGVLPCHTGLWIRYAGNTKYASKADIGYGGPVPAGWPERSIDLYQPTAKALGFSGLAGVDLALDVSNLKNGPGNTLIYVGGGTPGGAPQQTQPGLEQPTGSGELPNWSHLVQYAGAKASDRGSGLLSLDRYVRGVMRQGTTFHRQGGVPHVGSFVDLKLPGIDMRPPTIPRPVTAPTPPVTSSGRDGVVSTAEAAWQSIWPNGTWRQCRPFCVPSLNSRPYVGDCSQFFTQVYQAAGQPNPNGGPYDMYGDTTSLLAHGLPVGSPQPADGVFYSNPDHVALYIGDGLVIELGGTPGPRKIVYNYRVPTAYRSYFG